MLSFYCFFFFFSSRRRHTRCSRDWSSDVCSSDLTAPSRTFSDAAAARDYLRSRGAPIVIKADGLAAGKGVVVAHTLTQAQDAIDQMLVHHQHAAAGARVVLEDFLSGEE